MIVEEIQQRIERSPAFRSVEEKLSTLSPEVPFFLTGIRGSLLASFASFLLRRTRVSVLLITAEKDRAEELRDDCALILGNDVAHTIVDVPHAETLQLDLSAPVAKIEALRALTEQKPILVTVSAEALAVRLEPPEIFRSRVLELSVQQEYPFQQLLEQLAAWGFEKKDFVEEYGDYAVRGGIVDVFPFIGVHPLRFDFWGDTIESIREFDVLSQRSIRELTSATIVGGNGYDNSGISSNRSVSLFEYLPPNSIVIVDEPVLCQKDTDELREEGHTNIFSWEEIEEATKSYRRFVHTSFPAHTEAVLECGSLPHPALQGSVKRLIEQIRFYNAQHHDVLLMCDTAEEAKRIQEMIEEEFTAPPEEDEDQNLPLPHYRLVTEAFHRGFVFPQINLALLTEHEIFGRLKQREFTRRRRFRGMSQKELLQLHRGDFVVHQDYGIGKFAGLQKLHINGVETEVMKLQYEGRDTLYVNINFMNRVQKYSSKEGHTPKLSKLGAPDWERLKERARKKIKDIARDLILLYAKRKHEQGFACAPDTHWQKELEASFMYEDTPDQARTTAEIKRDMESSSPMDRLICGDVGFGKTEVAVRAAFKAVMNNKQVAVLVPTTILAQQHFQTFRDRLERYSVRVEMLNRFKSKKEQQNILAALREGAVDVLIGTHRLLSKDVVFKDMGLLIIDEEHRFGVAAKEHLRKLRATVDTLALTATPIPRTLQFSLLGARDLSLMTTPPRNRLPVHTEIAQFDKQLIREAILKELHRGGQVFFVHDRINDIDLVQRMLEELLPHARICIAHGQMKGHELERTMLGFLEKKFDILLCTKIIESGIDIPSVNTIIINRADRFGLAELYQLRGRVGRSNIQAYAYLLTPPFSVLPRQTLRKLQALEEFTELGSGFNLALRDLEIRGAGNLLGAEQSGFILEMGFELYQRIVEEAVQELKEKEFADLFANEPQRPTTLPETIIEVDIDAYIPDIYIEHDAERLDIYRRLYRATTTKELSAIREELIDRFGEYPEEVENLFTLVELRTLAAQRGFVKVGLQKNQATLYFPPAENAQYYEGEDAPFQRIMKAVSEQPHYKGTLKQEGKQLFLILHLPQKNTHRERLAGLQAFLASLP